MVAAMIREQRLEGILEGLRLAGFIERSAKPPSCRRSMTARLDG
jgi:hypothetical protein